MIVLVLMIEVIQEELMTEEMMTEEMMSEEKKIITAAAAAEAEEDIKNHIVYNATSQPKYFM